MMMVYIVFFIYSRDCKKIKVKEETNEQQKQQQKNQLIRFDIKSQLYSLVVLVLRSFKKPTFQSSCVWSVRVSVCFFRRKISTISGGLADIAFKKIYTTMT